MDASSNIDDQLAEYRRRQADRYNNDESESEDDEQDSLQKVYQPEQVVREVPPVMQKLPEPPQMIQPDAPSNSASPFLDDYELAKQLQDEENQKATGNHQNSSINSFGNNHNQPFTEDEVRPADNYREERLIADPNEEEMARQEFIRQQQMLYTQYTNTDNQPANRPANQPAADEMGPRFQEAGNPLLRNRNREI
mmetsp:Transcript_14602/g.12854  ORF Transcript_14602/g.12854 Transcript_14602/m.12854 type:complete len:195 (+) Transcript_14602:29-613(+)